MSQKFQANIPYGFHGILTDNTLRFAGLVSLGQNIVINELSGTQALNVAIPGERPSIYFLTGVRPATGTAQGLEFTFLNGTTPVSIQVAGVGTFPASIQAPAGQIVTSLTATGDLWSWTATYGPIPTRITSFSTGGFNGYMRDANGAFVGLALDGNGTPNLAIERTFVPFTDTNARLIGMVVRRPGSVSCGASGACTVTLTTNNGQVVQLPVPADVAAIQTIPNLVVSPGGENGQRIRNVYFLSLPGTPTDLVPYAVDTFPLFGPVRDSSALLVGLLVAVPVLFVGVGVYRWYQRRRLSRALAMRA